MAARSATSGSMILTFWVASPRPMLMTIFSSLGIAMALVMLSSLPSACLMSVSYFCLSRAAIIFFAFSTVAGLGFSPCTDAWGEPLLQDLDCRYFRYFKDNLLLLPFALLLGDRVATSLREANPAVAFHP